MFLGWKSVDWMHPKRQVNESKDFLLILFVEIIFKKLEGSKSLFTLFKSSGGKRKDTTKNIASIDIVCTDLKIIRLSHSYIYL